MRTLGTILLAAITSGLIAGLVQVELGIAFGAQEELILVLVAQTLFVIAFAFALLLAVVARGTARAVTTVSLALCGILLVGLAAIEGAALIAGTGAAPQEGLATDGPILLQFGVPALIGALVQWCIVWRHVRKLRRVASVN